MIHLYGFNIAKILFPLITLPYLARVLSVDAYGVVSFVRSVMVYIQLTVDFGFMLSGTKEIVEAGKDKEKISEITSRILFARIILAFVSFAVLLVLSFVLPILARYKTFALLSFFPVFLSVFLFDFVFRGIEKMQVISTRFVIMKSIALVFTFVMIKDDSNLLWIPLLDTIGSFIAVILVAFQLKKNSVIPGLSTFKKAWESIESSFNYFISNLATTAFNAFNTVVIGIVLTTTEVAYWGICMQLVGGIQALYTPIIDGVYPDMVRTKDLRQIRRILYVLVPVISAGCIFTYFFAGKGLAIVGGEDYRAADFLLRWLIPVLFFGFPSMLFGWPTLGAIEKQRTVAATTIAASLLQVVSVFVLIIAGRFSLTTVAIVRGFVELFLLIIRFTLTLKNKKGFTIISGEKNA